MKNEMRKKITLLLFWRGGDGGGGWAAVVCLSSAWKNVGMTISDQTELIALGNRRRKRADLAVI